MNCSKRFSCWIILLTLLATGCSGPAVQDETGKPTPASPVISGNPSPTSSAPSIAFPPPASVQAKMVPTPQIVKMATVQPEGGRWTTFIPPDWQERIQQKREVPTIVAIVTGDDGSVWFASMGGVRSSGTGVYRYDGQVWTHYTRKNGLPVDEITAMVLAPDGALWFSTLCCGVSRYDRRSWKTYSAANGLASDDVRSMAVAPDGSLWFGTGDNGVTHFDGHRWKTYSTQDGLTGNYVGDIAVLPVGILLVSTSDGSRAGLDRFDGQGWSQYSTEWSDRGKYTQDISFSSNGALWFVTEFDGVYRLAEGAWTHYTSENGLASDSVHCITVAPDGAIWFGTDHGVSRFDGKNWTTFTIQDGLISNWINSIAAAPDGSIWVGGSGGMSRYMAPGEAMEPSNQSESPALTPTASSLPGWSALPKATTVQPPSPTPARSNMPILLPSPDGKWAGILDREAGSLVVEDPQGEKHTIFPAGSTASNASWSPDSESLLVALINTPRPVQSAEEIGIAEIWLVTLSESGVNEPQHLHAPGPSDEDAAEWVTFGAWSPDGLRVLFWPGSRSASITTDGLPLWSLEVETGETTKLAEATLLNPTYQSWAPDGSALIFTNGGYRSAQVNKWLSLYEVENDQVRSLVARSEFIPGAVSWSPAGDLIAFAAVRESQTGKEWADWMSWDNPAIRARRIYLLDPNTGEYRRLNTSETYQDAPRWGTDGRTLYYIQIEGDQAVLMAADPASGEAQPLPDCQSPLPSQAGYYGQLDWSDFFARCPAIAVGKLEGMR